MGSIPMLLKPIEVESVAETRVLLRAVNNAGTWTIENVSNYPTTLSVTYWTVGAEGTGVWGGVSRGLYDGSATWTISSGGSITNYDDEYSLSEMDFWFKLTGTIYSSTYEMSKFGSGAAYPKVTLSYTKISAASGYMKFVLTSLDASGVAYTFTSSDFLISAVYRHFRVVRLSNSYALWINGIYQGETPVHNPASLLSSSSESYAFGGGAIGYFDEIRISDGVRWPIVGNFTPPASLEVFG